MNTTKVLMIAGLMFFAAIAEAHEFWIEPTNSNPNVGDKVEFKLRVGERFEGEPVLRKNERIQFFGVIAPKAEQPLQIPGEEGADPAGAMLIKHPGLHIIGYHNTPSHIELEPAKFADYLKEDGLEHIIAERAKLGETEKPGREAYERCAKSLMAVPGAEVKGLDRALGFPIEIIPSGNPFNLKSGDAITVRVLFREKPLAGLKVSAIRRGAQEKVTSTQTADDGTAKINIDEPGLWMIYGVHMIRAKDDPKADWHSFWASLTFETGGLDPQRN